MSSQLIDGLVKEFDEKLGDRAFFTLPELVSLGLFGTIQTARLALQAGEIPSIRISKRRCIILRTALIDYIQKGLIHSRKLKSQDKS